MPCSTRDSHRRSCIRRRRISATPASRRPSAEPYRDQLLGIGKQFGVEIPLDKPEVEIMLCVPRTDIEHYPSAVAALARVMQHLGVSCTFRSDGLVAENYGYYAGGKEWQREISLQLIEQAHRLQGARPCSCPSAVMPTPRCAGRRPICTASRCPSRSVMSPNSWPRSLQAGRLKLENAGTGKTTFHDPCQLVRKGGVTDAPRTLMKAMGIELHELKNHGGFSFCCGGGGGVLDIERAAPLRYRTMENKLREIDDTGARDLPHQLLGLPAHLR